MIEILVTGLDYVTNNMHLAAISSPQVLSKFVNVEMNKNLDQAIFYGNGRSAAIEYFHDILRIPRCDNILYICLCHKSILWPMLSNSGIVLFF